MAVNTLWGGGAPQIIFDEPYLIHDNNGRIITLPQPARMENLFPPDAIKHDFVTGNRTRDFRGFRLYCVLYYDLLTKAESIEIRDAIDWNKQYTLRFKPHSDYSYSYWATVNEDEGFNLLYSHDKMQAGHSAVLIFRGTEWLPGLGQEETDCQILAGALVV